MAVISPAVQAGLHAVSPGDGTGLLRKIPEQAVRNELGGYGLIAVSRFVRKRCVS